MKIDRIFIIDDDPVVADLLNIYAGLFNIQTDTANSWAEVDIDLLKQADLLMLDLSMPEVDGLDMLVLLEQENVSVPISICSAQDDNVVDTVVDLLKSHGLCYAGKLLKPFTPDDFAELLETIAINSSNQLPAYLHATPIANKAISKDILKQALKEDWFNLVYQPQFFAEQGAVYGMECLARLDIPGEKTIMPDVFISALSAYGLMDDFTLQIFQLGLSSVDGLSLPEEFKIAFNLSPSSISEEFLNRLIACCKQYKFPIHNIVLEVTETSTLDINQHTKKLLTKLRLQGFNLSLDDFGTGYSTIQEIDSLPFNEIKIDKIFVQSMHDKNTSMAIVSSTIELADKLNFRVIAEGVETQQQAETLATLNCPVTQGYLYARPMSEDKFIHFLAQQKVT